MTGTPLGGRHIRTTWLHALHCTHCTHVYTLYDRRCLSVSWHSVKPPADSHWGRRCSGNGLSVCECEGRRAVPEFDRLIEMEGVHCWWRHFLWRNKDLDFPIFRNRMNRAGKNKQQIFVVWLWIDSFLPLSLSHLTTRRLFLSPRTAFCASSHSSSSPSCSSSCSSLSLVYFIFSEKSWHDRNIKPSIDKTTFRSNPG